MWFCLGGVRASWCFCVAWFVECPSSIALVQEWNWVEAVIVCEDVIGWGGKHDGAPWLVPIEEAMTGHVMSFPLTNFRALYSAQKTQILCGPKTAGAFDMTRPVTPSGGLRREPYRQF